MKLSICIPTRQRLCYLQQVLKSILDQKQDVEIVISDNASSDGTEAWVFALQKQYPSIIYERFEEEVPCGQNLLKSVSLASGEYCWLMSDDDAIAPGSIQHIQELLASYRDLSGISVDVEGYDQTLKKKKKIHYSHFLKEQQLFLQAEETFVSLGAWMGFWSAHIVHRQRWQEILQEEKHVAFLGYYHLYILLNMVKKHPTWLFTPFKAVHYRSDNESFSKEYGRLQRFTIDTIAYDQIGKELFSSKACKKVNQVVIRRLLFWQLIRAKCEGLSLKIVFKMLSISFHTYKGLLPFWTRLAPILIAPRPLLLTCRFLYRKKKGFS